jgi:hypothetical protein
VARLIPFLLGGIAALLSFNDLPLLSDASGQRSASRVHPLTNALNKSDRLTVSARQPSSEEIATIEVVGLRDPAIIYRARDGRELFRTDPVSNVTVISKGVLLPEMTVRARTGSPVRELPVDPLREQAIERKPPASPRVPVGCEPLFSPLTQHPSVAHHSGRCMAELPQAPRLAAALH